MFFAYNNRRGDNIIGGKYGRGTCARRDTLSAPNPVLPDCFIWQLTPAAKNPFGAVIVVFVISDYSRTNIYNILVFCDRGSLTAGPLLKRAIHCGIRETEPRGHKNFWLISTVLIIIPGLIEIQMRGNFAVGLNKARWIGRFWPAGICHAYPEIICRRMALHCLPHYVRMNIDPLLAL